MQREIKSVLNLDMQQVFETWENLIRLGHIQQVIAMIEDLKPRKIPRIYAQKVAHFYYRTGLFSQGLQTLAPIVYPKKRFGEPASEVEIATYAILLIKIGSVREARKLLSGLSDEVAEVHLYRAFADQAEWDYESAIPHLRQYLARTQISSYQRAVAEVNLVAALIDTGGTREARLLLTALLEKGRSEEWKLIQKNSQELLGQLAVAMKDYEAAQQILKEAALSPNRDSGIYDFFIDKWQAIVRLQQHPESKDAQDEIRNIRERALRLRHWESVRECDRCLAFARKDQGLFNQIYFGTLFPAYREKLMREAASWARLPEKYIRGSSSSEILNLTTGQSLSGKIHLKSGQTLHRVLAALAGDRYRPLYVGQLFALAFPNESFISEFSEARVAAAVSRLRKWAEQNHLPLKIEVRDQFYRLEIDEGQIPFGLLYLPDHLPQNLEDSMEFSLARLQVKIRSLEFSSRQAAEMLEISKSSAVRLISWAVQRGKLQSFGSNKTTKYRFQA